MSVRSIFLAASLVVTACDRGTSTNTVTEQRTGDPWTLQAIESLGDRAAYLAVVDVNRWPALARELAASGLPDDESAWLTAETPVQSLQLGLKLAGVTAPVTVTGDPFAGLDAARPIVLALAEPPAEMGERFASAAAIVRGALPGLRHEVLLPATDVALLHRSLGEFFDANKIGTARPELVAGDAKASAWQVGTGAVALVDGPDHVRLIAVTHASAPTSASLLRPAIEAPVRTAGVVAAALKDAPLALLVRARAQARLAVFFMAHEGLAGAASGLPTRPQQRAAIVRALRCEAWIHGGKQELEDWTISATADERSLAARVVMSLADAGVEVVDAGVAGAGKTRTPQHDDLLVHAWLRLAPDAMLAAAHGPAAPPEPSADLARQFEACGVHLPALVAVAPMARMQHVLQLVGGGAQSNGGTAYQVAMRETAPGVMHSAVAVEVTGSVDPWTGLWPVLGSRLGGPPQVELTPSGERTRIDVGFGDRAGALLGALAPASDELAGASVWLAPLRARLADQKELAPLLRRERLRVGLRRSGRALVGDVALTDAAEVPVPLDMSHVTWSERQVEQSPGDACAVAAASAAAAELGDPAVVGPARSRQTIRDGAGEGGVAALTSIDAASQCPAAAAEPLRRISALTIAGELVDEWRIEEAAKLLARACEASRDEQVCLRATEVAQQVAPNIPHLYAMCDELVPIADTHRVALAAGGLALDDRRVADVPALVAALEALVATGDEITVELGVDAAMRFAEVRPLLAALSPLKKVRLTVAVRQQLGDHGATVQVPILAPELGAAARTDDPQWTPRFKAGTVVFAVEGTMTRLRAGMINLGTESVPAPFGLFLNMRGRVDNGEKPLVHASDDAPWGTVALALAGGCTGARLIEPAREDQLLGPAWRDADCLNVYHGPKPLSVTPKHRGPNNINSGLLSVRPMLEHCYAAGLIDDEQLAGRVIATYGIDANGRVTMASVTGTTLNDPKVHQCMAEAIRTGSHSSADGPVVVRYAFDFKTKQR